MHASKLCLRVNKNQIGTEYKSERRQIPNYMINRAAWMNEMAMAVWRVNAIRYVYIYASFAIKVIHKAITF